MRPVQSYVLNEWHKSRRAKRDLIVKLHTGQGKTLIGLLMLQSKLHEGIGPALYLCPNNFLVEQTCIQASQFGVAVVQPDPDIPDAFLNGDAVMVTTVQKLFNGLTKFGLGPRSINAGVVLLDDSHACIDTIKQACSISLTPENHAYHELLQLFENDLRHQGLGAHADICNGNFEALLAIPYWSWIDQIAQVTKILARNKDTDDVKFAWPLIRDKLDDCLCIITGNAINILPYSAPLGLFGTFFDATHRIFMSATVTDDSFLVKGLRLPRTTIENPLTFPRGKVVRGENAATSVAT